MRLMVLLLPLLWMTPAVPDRVVLPALPHPPPQPNALPAVREGVALEQLVEEGRKLWFEDAPAGAEPFGVPTVPHGLTGVPGWNATHDGVLSVLNFVRPTGLIPHGGGMPVGMVDGDTMAQTCSACHTDAPNGTPIPGLANRHYSQKAMFRLGRMTLLAHKTALGLHAGQEAQQQAVDAELEKLTRYQALQDVGCRDDLAPGVVTGVRIWHVTTGLLTNPSQLATPAGKAAFPCGAVKIPPLNTLRWRNLHFWDGSINTSWPGRWPVLDFMGLARVEEGQDKTSTRKAQALDAFLAWGMRSPAWQEVFPGTPDHVLAQRGAQIFHAPGRCASCHGSHDADGMLMAFEPGITPLAVVGTNPERAVAALDEVLKRMATVPGGFVPRAADPTVERGYVNVPLCSPFLNYPYLHTGSVASLWELLLPARQRSARFYVGKTVDHRDVGYFTPSTFGRALAKGPAASNFVHRGVPQRLRAGHEGEAFGTTLSNTDKRALLEFLKTARCPDGIPKNPALSAPPDAGVTTR